MIIDNSALELLAQDWITLSVEQLAALHGHCDGIRAANEALSLVSMGDAAKLETIHLTDSLSLAPVVRRYAGPRALLLDIGSGGGFPAIPLKIALPDLEVILVERSLKKADFLRDIVQTLGLNGVRVVLGEFPFAVRDFAPQVITARAVEKPEKLRRQVLTYMCRDCAFLCQLPERLGEFPPMFHVEPVHDDWKKQGLRRGVLNVVTRIGSGPKSSKA